MDSHLRRRDKSLKDRLSNHDKLPCVKRHGGTHIHAHTTSGGQDVRRDEETKRRISSPNGIRPATRNEENCRVALIGRADERGYSKTGGIRLWAKRQCHSTRAELRNSPRTSRSFTESRALAGGKTRRDRQARAGARPDRRAPTWRKGPRARVQRAD
jgi:hypothetical protein